MVVKPGSLVVSRKVTSFFLAVFTGFNWTFVQLVGSLYSSFVVLPFLFRILPPSMPAVRNSLCLYCENASGARSARCPGRRKKRISVAFRESWSVVFRETMNRSRRERCFVKVKHRNQTLEIVCCKGDNGRWKCNTDRRYIVSRGHILGDDKWSYAVLWCWCFA